MRATLHHIQISLFLLLILALAGCESIHYYGQAIQGQTAIITKRRPIARILAEPETPEKLKIKLQQVLDLREFAAKTLRLPVKDHYLTYVALDRPYVVWTIFAAPEFSFSPKTWRFPIVGHTAYRGYFSEKNARRYADNLKNKGWDVHIGHVAAYSTLGWFNDPVLSTVINRSQAGLARILFHELAHQVLYVEDDTMFNESFATAVEQEGIRRWALATNNPQAYEEYLVSRKRETAFATHVMTYRNQLKKIYLEEIPLAEKRSQKEETINAFRAQYQKLKQQWHGYSGYDAWFEAPINNAKINTVTTYYQLVPAFEILIQETKGDLKQFYDTCRILAQKPKKIRQKDIQKIRARHLSIKPSPLD